MVGLDDRLSFGDTGQRTISFTVLGTQDLRRRLLPCRHGHGRCHQRSENEQTSSNFELHHPKPLIALPNAAS